MGGKHKKKLRAEKAKVQLKKKKLPKGQNITDTSFKVKKILTVEQLKKPDENEPVSNWKVTLKDLLNRLSHCNCTTRLNSLTGIKEILTKSPEILLGPSLKPMISRLLERLTDEEHKVRKKSVNLVSEILDQLPQDMRTPFFDILNAYLLCAMTHRNASIQKDSLKFVDVIVQYYPGALKHKLEMLMQNFLRILRTFLYGSQTQVLSMNGAKQELEKSKTKMLAKFYRFLEACYSDGSVTESYLRNSDKNVLEEQKISLRDSCDLYKNIPDLSEVFKSSASKENAVKESDSEDLKSLCSSIMPLLFDMWTEFSPNPKMDDISFKCVVKESVGELLCVLLKIMLLLNEKVMATQDSEMESWFVSNYSQTFEKSFTTNFPYFPSVSRKRLSPSDHTDSPRKSVDTCMEQNLIICYLSYSFKLVHRRSDLKTKIEDCISRALGKKNPEEVDILSRVVEAAVNASKSCESKVLNMAVTAHMKTKSPGLQLSLSKLLTKVALEESENLSQMGGNFENWVVLLTHLLFQPQIYLHEVETILKLIIKPNGAKVLREIEHIAEAIVENLPNIKVEGIVPFEGQRMIASILYRCNEHVLQEIIETQVLDSPAYSESLRNYLLEIFYQKLGRQLELF